MDITTIIRTLKDFNMIASSNSLEVWFVRVARNTTFPDNKVLLSIRTWH